MKADRGFGHQSHRVDSGKASDNAPNSCKFEAKRPFGALGPLLRNLAMSASVLGCVKNAWPWCEIAVMRLEPADFRVNTAYFATER